MFSDRSEHAFSLVTVYQAMVCAAAYGLSPLMCMTMKLYLCLVYLAVTIVCYTALEVIVRRDKVTVKIELNTDPISKSSMLDSRMVIDKTDMDFRTSKSSFMDKAVRLDLFDMRTSNIDFMRTESGLLDRISRFDSPET